MQNICNPCDSAIIDNDIRVKHIDWNTNDANILAAIWIGNRMRQDVVLSNIAYCDIYIESP